MSAAAEPALRLSPRPAGAGGALNAALGAVFGLRAAGARRAEAAAWQVGLRVGLHRRITLVSSVQVKPPFRDAKMRSTTVPDTIGTGNCCSCRVARFPFQWPGRPGFLFCFQRTLCFPFSLWVRVLVPRIAVRAGRPVAPCRSHGFGRFSHRADRLWPPSFRSWLWSRPAPRCQ
jgi:hypothetical protein